MQTVMLNYLPSHNCLTRERELGVNQVDPKTLKSHPRNCSIYGEDEDLSELMELICQSGWVKPLVITSDNVIISGHRRWKAALELRIESIHVEVRSFPDELAELEALLLENASRFKTTEQKVREAQAWKEVEAKKARLRMSDAAKTRFQGVENFPHPEKGKTRDRIAARVGLGSGRTYSKAAQVIAVIDEETQKGNLASAQVLRKVLNEQSVDAAHIFLKKPPQERSCIANLIVSGAAKSTFQAAEMVRQNNYTEFNAPSQENLAGFSVGDWVIVNDLVQEFKTYIGSKGQIEQIWAVEQQISINIENGPDKIRFYPHELTLIALAAPPSLFRAGDIVFVDIDRHEAASAQEKKWNGFWGLVTAVGEMGSLMVNVGRDCLQLFPRDLKPVDAPSADLRHVVERVLRLRGFGLDEIEERMLDVLQRREWFTHSQLIHLENIEKLYPEADFYETEKSQVAQRRGP